MSETKAKIRLFVDAMLGPGQPVALGEGQAHYLFSVMRLVEGDELRLFNGRDGEWRARVVQAGKRRGGLEVLAQTGVQQQPVDLWLLFAPLKKARMDMVVEKAAELGVARIVPVLTRRTGPERLRADRLQAQLIEGAEQCGATFVAEVGEALPLARLLAEWPSGRHLIFCDESGVAAPMAEVMAGLKAGPAAVLVGPEGGFSQEEAVAVRAVAQAVPVSLGPRILRAETAAIAALALFQAVRGDWR